MKKYRKAPNIAERMALLRERCLDRKAGDGNASIWKAIVDLKAIVDAETFRTSGHTESWQIRMGLRTKARLQNIRFEIDELELLAGRVSFAGHGFSKSKIEASAKYLSKYKWPEGQTGHCALDMSRIFKVGIKGILLELAQRLKSSSAETKNTYQSFIYAVEGLAGMIENAKLAAGAAEKDAAGWRKKELKEIIESCERIKTDPPGTFRDAIQIIWFVDMGCAYADNAGLVVPGHLDRDCLLYTSDAADE